MAFLQWSLLFLMILNIDCQRPEIDPNFTFEEDKSKYPEDYCRQIENNEEFDFIVVGSGASGSTVARRLAEIPSNKVLLLEAGENPPEKWAIPGGLKDRWNFQSTQNPYACFGYIGNTCKYFPRKVLGGSSVMHGLTYVRGNKEDYNTWESQGAKGWSYKDVLPYFMKLENFMAHPIVDSETFPNCRNAHWKSHGYKNNASFCKQNEAVNSGFHSTGGPLTISAYNNVNEPSMNAVRQSILESFQENGVPYNNDVNGADQIGVTNLPKMADRLGHRNNIAKAYLLNIPNNLKVCKSALVYKVILNPSTSPKVVEAVDFVHFTNSLDGGFRQLQAVARKEYIISAGALNSPGILERSGIGIPEILEAAGVEPILHLKVGENFQDQFINAASSFSLDYNSEVTPNPLSMPLTSLTAFINILNPDKSVPDIQYYLAPASALVDAESLIKPELTQQVAELYKTLILFSDTILQQTKSGSVHIRQSREPLLTPKIVLNILSTDRDVELTVKSTRFARKVMSHEELRSFNAKPFIFDECKKYTLNSEEEIMCGARLLPYSLYHQAGTCSMGPANNSSSVVDPELRVIGTKNLRVVDTSVMPLVSSGHTQMPAVMIGEKAADLIKKAWGQI